MTMLLGKLLMDLSPSGHVQPRLQKPMKPLRAASIKMLIVQPTVRDRL